MEAIGEKKVWNSIKHLHVHLNAHEVLFIQEATDIWYLRCLMIDLHGYQFYTRSY